MPEETLSEPWLRGTLAELPSVHRAVLHALELAGEDLQRWCGHLSDAQLNQSPARIAPIAFHLRHISRSLDRLLTYAEGASLSEKQLIALQSELAHGASREELFAELASALTTSAARIRSFSHANLEASRSVGRNHLPTTLGGLLVHIADHTQRHVGQAITTAKIVLAQAP
ncbi:MAG TPA: DinB family protein [Candidatus Acidoferrum sp.]|nr:DinB family protein [Candidatus Acidoferrum sp.]